MTADKTLLSFGCLDRSLFFSTVWRICAYLGDILGSLRCVTSDNKTNRSLKVLIPRSFKNMSSTQLFNCDFYDGSLHEILIHMA